MRVDTEQIEAALRVLDDFNRLDLKEVEFFTNGVKINIDPHAVEQFRFTGLSNKTFVEAGLYLPDAVISFSEL